MQAARQQAKNPTKLPYTRYITEMGFTAANLGVNGSDTGPRNKARHSDDYIMNIILSHYPIKMACCLSSCIFLVATLKFSLILFWS